jgi:hypothetical protein
MTRTSSFVLCAALLLAVASADTFSTATLGSSAFSAAPGKVFDGTVSTGADRTTWGTYTGAVFGPGSTNATVFAYGWTLASTTSISSVVSRTLNATLLSNGTADTTEYSIIGSDVAYSTAITIQSGSVQTAVGLGTFALAYAAADSTGCGQVYVAIFTGGTAAPTTKAITSNACNHCTSTGTATTGAGYANIVNNVFYENSTFYVSYTTTVYTEKSTTATTSGCSTGSTFPSAVATSTSNTVVEVDAQVFSYLQGVSTSGTLKWAAAATIYTGTASTSGNLPSPQASAIMASCGQGNYTNSTNFLCAYTVTTAVSYIPVVVSTGTAGTASPIATSTIVGANYPQTINTYTVAGFVHSQYQQGILLNNLATSYSAANTVSGTVNTLQLYNLTSGASSTTGATAGGIATVPAITNTYASGQYSGMGIANSMGWGLIDTYSSASGAYASEYSTWLANGTANVSKVSFSTGAVSVAPSVFVDANGALWAGAYSLDITPTIPTLTTGYLGKLAAQLYSSSTSSMARLVICFFFGLISLVALLVF